MNKDTTKALFLDRNLSINYFFYFFKYVSAQVSGSLVLLIMLMNFSSNFYAFTQSEIEKTYHVSRMGSSSCAEKEQNWIDFF